MPKATHARPSESADFSRIGSTAASANPCVGALRRWCEANPLQTHARWAVAYSAGADSTALLLAAHVLHPGRVVAFHVNHGIQAAARDFEQHARGVCEQMGIELAVAHATVPRGPGLSLEAEARGARYKALTRMAVAHKVDCVLLAHHLDDQAETVCLAWLRGAGLRGLAAMPTVTWHGGIPFYRPMLGVSGKDIREWLQSTATPHIEDPTNQSTDHLRNAIRLRLSPVLESLAPSYRHTFARTARHVAQAQRLLDGLAKQDLSGAGEPPLIKSLQMLDDDRLDNALRYWLYAVHHCSPSTAQLAELRRQVRACTTRGHGIELRVGRGRVQRCGASVQYLP